MAAAFQRALPSTASSPQALPLALALSAPATRDANPAGPMQLAAAQTLPEEPDHELEDHRTGRMPDDGDEVDAADSRLDAAAPISVRAPGRHRETRYRSHAEASRGIKGYKCTVCDQLSHTRRSCPLLLRLGVRVLRKDQFDASLKRNGVIACILFCIMVCVCVCVCVCVLYVCVLLLLCLAFY